MPVDSTSKPETNNALSTSSATLLRKHPCRCNKTQHLALPPTEISLQEILLRRPESQPMLLQTKWRLGPVQEEAGATARGASKAAVAAQLSTTAYPRRPNLRCNRRMLLQVRAMPRARTHLALAQVRHPRVQSQHVRTAAPPSHHSGEGTMPVTSSAMRAVCGFWQLLQRECSLTMHRTVLQASRHPPTCCHEEARDKAPQARGSRW